jgi:predicted nucleic acid-binding protein
VAGIKLAVFDTGPLIHLNEIRASGILRLFGQVLVSSQVIQELGSDFTLPSNCKQVQLLAKAKDYSKLLAAKYEIDFTEATAIALSKQENCSLIFTDDLDAREAAKTVGLNPHGTLAIITRAYQENALTRKQALSYLDLLQTKSSLYVTTDLINWAKSRVIEHK